MNASDPPIQPIAHQPPPPEPRPAAPRPPASVTPLLRGPLAVFRRPIRRPAGA